MAVMMAPAETAEAPVQPTGKTASFATYSDLYEHVLRLVDRLHPADKLHLVEYIIGTVHPLVDDLYEDEEELAAEAKVTIFRVDSINISKRMRICRQARRGRSGNPV